MKEAFEKIKERLEQESNFFGGKPMGTLQKAYYCNGVERAISIVNQVAGEYNDRIFINGQCCWQSCACTEKCQECNRYTLINTDIDWYESIEAWDDEFGKDTNVRSNDDWIPCSQYNPKKNGWYLVTNQIGVVQQQFWGTNHWHRLRDEAVIAWQPLPEPYKPKGE